MVDHKVFKDCICTQNGKKFIIWFEKKRKRKFCSLT